MKAFVSFIASVAIYIVLGLIMWNIVFSMMDVGGMTPVHLIDIRFITYSALTFIITCGIPMFSGDSVENNFYLFTLIVLGVNLLIAIGANHWENIWDNVSTILNIIYNLVNVGMLTLIIYAAIDKNKN